MSKIDQLFEQLRKEKRRALMPFVTAGDPDIKFTSDLLREIVAQGGSMCEVGVPYSDPIADGPVIQASYTRALASGIKLSSILDMLTNTTPLLSAPVVTMVSYAIIHRHGKERYIEDALAAGVAGAIVPDLLVEEAEAMSRLCRKKDFSLIQLVTPTTPRERALRIAASSTGFLYYVSITGITGERSQLPASLLDNVAWLRERTPLPVCIGFGISTSEHVKLLAPVADGLIVGSAVVRRVARLTSEPNFDKPTAEARAEVCKDVGAYVRGLADALAACPLA